MSSRSCKESSRRIMPALIVLSFRISTISYCKPFIFPKLEARQYKRTGGQPLDQRSVSWRRDYSGHRPFRLRDGVQEPWIYRSAETCGHPPTASCPGAFERSRSQPLCMKEPSRIHHQPGSTGQSNLSTSRSLLINPAFPYSLLCLPPPAQGNSGRAWRCPSKRTPAQQESACWNRIRRHLAVFRWLRRE